MMPTARLGSYEIRRFKGTLPRIALAFLIFIPLLYGALYLWSNWDPYGRLDQVPVAVVNHDLPVTAEGQTVDAGAQFVDELHHDRIFDWHFTDQNDADAGLADGRYYLVITVPQDFSANLASGAGTDPRRAVLLMHRDDVNGYVIGMLTASVQTQLENAIDKAAIGTYFQAVFVNLDKIRDGMNSAVDGSAQLATGLDDAAPGAHRLATGLDDANAGSAKLVSGLADAKQGADRLASGAKDATAGAGTLTSGLDTAKTGSRTLAGGLDQLTGGAETLADGADQVADGNRRIDDAVGPVIDRVVAAVPQITAAGDRVSGDVADLTAQVSTGTNSLADRAAAVSDAYAALLKAHPDLAGDPAVAALGDAVGRVDSSRQQIAATANKVATAAAEIHSAAADINQHSAEITSSLTGAKTKLDDLADGAAQVASGAHQLRDKLSDAADGSHSLSAGIADADSGAHQLHDGLTTLSSGAAQLDSGIGTLHTGAAQLHSGIGRLQSGAQSLDGGLSQLDSGAHRLHDALTGGAKRLPVLTPDQQHNAAQVLSSPADVRLTIDHPARLYGRGLAPFFFAIAIWVFGISAFLVLRPISGRALAGRAGASRLALAGWIPVAAMAILGSLILLGVSWVGLGLDPVHVAASFGVVILAAVCFSAIAHVLRTALGTVGSAITLVLLTAAALAACIAVVARRKRFAFADLHPALT